MYPIPPKELLFNKVFKVVLTNLCSGINIKMGEKELNTATN